MKGTAKNPREAALLILEQIFLRGAYANLALAQGLRGAPLSPLDRKLTTELVYGTVKTMGTLDWYLSRVVNRPLRKLDPLVLVILRLGAYQLLYLDRIPASAACNESVKLAKKWVHEGAGKLVNGALRQLARTRDQWKFPQGPDHELERIALEYYHPEWLVRRWKFRYGLEEAVKLCAFDNARPAFSFRVNTLRDTREGLQENWRKRASGPASQWSPDGLLCDSLPSLDDLVEGFGPDIYIQDESSMLDAAVLDPQPGNGCWICAVPREGRPPIWPRKCRTREKSWLWTYTITNWPWSGKMPGGWESTASGRKNRMALFLCPNGKIPPTGFWWMLPAAAWES